jgi:hypothetical protein
MKEIYQDTTNKDAPKQSDRHGFQPLEERIKDHRRQRQGFKKTSPGLMN